MEPTLAYSSLTGSVFVITKWVKGEEGHVAAKKFDVTDEFRSIVEALGYIMPSPFVHNPWCNPGGICVCAENLDA